MADGKKLSLGEHLEELRRRVIYSIVFFVIAIIISFIFQEPIIKIIITPHLKVSSGNPLKIFNYPEGFFVYFKASLIAGFLASLPFILYQFWEFVSGGLYPTEKKYVMFYLPVSLLLFTGGVIFNYFVFLPMLLKFLLYYSNSSFIDSSINLNNYFSLFIMLTLVMGLVFQLPIVMLFLVQIKVVSAKTYWSKIRFSILLAFIIAAIITPSGDPVTQTLLAIPLLLLYIIGIILSYYMPKLIWKK
jgi:Tat protein translocase TatC